MRKSRVISKINPIILNGVAHRGLWNKYVPENSLKAFELAMNNNVAFECDVHLTKDNNLVVIHDSDLKRLTGKEGIIEDLTLKELKTNYSLSDGQKISSLDEVLDLINERVPILIELKTRGDNYLELANKAEQVLSKRIIDKRNCILISLDPRSLLPFKKSGLIRMFVVSTQNKHLFSKYKRKVEAADFEKVLFEDKRIQKYSKNHFVNSWTIKNKEDIEYVKPFVDTITFDTIESSEIKKHFRKANNVE